MASKKITSFYNVVNGTKTDDFRFPGVSDPSEMTVTPGSGSNIPANCDTLDDVLNALGANAFSSTDDFVHFDDSDPDDGNTLPSGTEIDDSSTSTSLTWSSDKLKSIFEDLGVTFNQNGTWTVNR